MENRTNHVKTQCIFIQFKKKSIKNKKEDDCKSSSLFKFRTTWAI